MLQFPINVLPDNTTLTETNFPYSFTAKGDILSGWIIRYTNYTTGEIGSYTYVLDTDRKPYAYNNDKIAFTVQTQWNAGDDYLWQMMLLQFTQDGTEPVCDMPLIRSNIRGVNSSTSFTIDDGIGCIYQWSIQTPLQPEYANGVRANYIEMQIGNVRRRVASYNKQTGEIILESAFPTQPSENDKFQLYANYLITPQYFFKSRSLPTLSTEVESSIESLDNKVSLMGEYSQAQISFIRHWNVAYGVSHGQTAPVVLLGESGNIYSQNISYDMYDLQKGLVNYVNLWQNQGVEDLFIPYYRFTTSVTTDDGVIVNSSNYIAQDVSDEELDNPPSMSWRLSKNKCILNPMNRMYPTVASYPSGISGYIVKRYRKNLDTGEIFEVYGSVTSSDVTLPHKGNFKYYTFLFKSDGTLLAKHILEQDVSVDLGLYTLSELIPIENVGTENSNRNKPKYKVGTTYRFDCDIADTSTTLNTGVQVQSGNGKYAYVSKGESAYESGSFSALLGTWDDTLKELASTPKMVRDWENFISEGGMYLFKSAKGNVRIISITDSPTIECEEVGKQKPITISFSWVEVADVNDFIIGDFGG